MSAKTSSLAWLRRSPLLAAALLAIVAVTVYWQWLAADRYVSEARVVLQRSDLSSGQVTDIASLIGGPAGGSRSDQLWLRDHLLSVDMLREAEAALQLRAHYSQRGDWFTRLWSADEPLELFHEYFQKRITVELDEFAGVLSIEVQAYTPQMAHALAAFLLERGEQAMNRMGHALAEEQVHFLEQQVATLGTRVQATRMAVMDFQNKRGLVSPTATTENLAAVVGRLEAQLSELQTRRRALIGYLQPSAPNVVELDLQIAAVEKQMQQERDRLAAPAGKRLNAAVEEFQRLELEAQFAQDIFKTALVALEKGRVEATRTLKKLTVLQSPVMPEYPLRPRRHYNTVVYSIVILLLAGVAHLLLAIVRDHQD